MITILATTKSKCCDEIQVSNKKEFNLLKLKSNLVERVLKIKFTKTLDIRNKVGKFY